MKNPFKGTVLIEFAVCIPILVILLFYANDLIRIRRYYAQTEFVAQQTINILQNISQKRESKKITLADWKYALALSSLTTHPGSTRFKNSDKFELGHCLWINLHYVKGIDDGSAQRIWYRWVGGDSSSTNISSFYSSTNVNQYTSTKWNGTKLTYPSIKINPGEIKIIAEAYYCRYPLGTVHRHVDDKQAFGLHLVTPKRVNGNGNWFSFFPSIVIFTPKPGLFDETSPS